MRDCHEKWMYISAKVAGEKLRCVFSNLCVYYSRGNYCALHIIRILFMILYKQNCIG